MSRSLFLALTFVLSACGSTTAPSKNETQSNGFRLENLVLKSGILSLKDQASPGKASTRPSAFKNLETISEISFDLVLKEIGHDHYAQIHAYTDANDESGLKLKFFLDSHHPGEVSLALELSAKGRELAHFHLVDDVPFSQTQPLNEKITIQIQPQQPYFEIKTGNDLKTVFNSNDNFILRRQLRNTTMGQYLKVELNGNSELTIPVIK